MLYQHLINQLTSLCDCFWNAFNSPPSLDKSRPGSYTTSMHEIMMEEMLIHFQNQPPMRDGARRKRRLTAGRHWLRKTVGRSRGTLIGRLQQ